MVTYAGLPGPVISEHLTRAASREHYAPGTEFLIAKIEMIANTGTYLDSPFHRYARGKDLAGLDLYSVANLEGIVVRTSPTDHYPIDQVGLERWMGRHWAIFGGLATAKG